MTNLKKWKLINSQLVFNNQWCRIRQDKVELTNGEIIDDYFVNVRPDIVFILPITQAQEIVFVSQYRHGIKKILLELPAGRIDSDQEDALGGAQRELEEETGYVASNWIELGTIYDNPVKDTNTIYLYIALDACPLGQQELDLTEEIEVVLIPLEDVKEKINSGEICVAGTIAGIYLGLDFLSKINN